MTEYDLNRRYEHDMSNNKIWCPLCLFIGYYLIYRIYRISVYFPEKYSFNSVFSNGWIEVEETYQRRKTSAENYSARKIHMVTAGEPKSRSF